MGWRLSGIVFCALGIVLFVAALIGHATDNAFLYTFGGYGGTSINTALGGICFGICLFLIIWFMPDVKR